MQDTDDQNVSPINFVEYGMRSMVIPSKSFADAINGFAKPGAFRDGLKTGD